MEIELATARLRIRRAQPHDLDALHALVSDYEVVKMTASWPWPADRAFTATRATPYDPEKGLAGPVFLGADLIGMAGVTAGEDGVAVLGYMFARRHWGQGYATEMGHALIDYAFEVYDWAKITAGVLEDNPASARVLEKLGFAETGRATGPCAARRAELPMRCFERLRA